MSKESESEVVMLRWQLREARGLADNYHSRVVEWRAETQRLRSLLAWYRATVMDNESIDYLDHGGYEVRMMSDEDIAFIRGLEVPECARAYDENGKRKGVE